MSMISPHFKLSLKPQADPAAIVTGSGVRFTVLTSRLLRLEHSPTGQFEDRASQAFWYREQPVPPFDVAQSAETIEISTEHLHLRYTVNPAGFTPDSLTITLKDSGTVWHYGDANPQNLLGTTRTLDRSDGTERLDMPDGRVHLEEGLLSRAGWSVYDDSKRLVFNEEGWLEARPNVNANKDVYFFGYGQDYRACLDDFVKVTGPVPMVPRWALGNWWSRYWAYTQEELTGLMEDFKANDVPLSVCIVDMDWHITRTGNASSGWTGYTWNKDLFPDHQGFLNWLHEQGLHTGLNLHPAEGIHNHEAQYPALADFLGHDTSNGEPIEFNIADPKFSKGYFELLHHPMEAEGVDFWWMDWQQGELSSMPGLDPLWWLNHLHFYDLARDDRRMPFIFSRWGGLGNHRYPIGFSGDTHVSWDSLAFQPYFTSTASNVGYSWWSHDIGGHMQGVEDSELYTRWVQYGVFSPILRLHSTNNPYHDRRPWGYDREVMHITRDALQLRHALIPYIYSMAWRNHSANAPLIAPMYYDYPEHEEAYHCPNQYAFGSELIAAPFISPADKTTRLSRQVVWLPEGDWFGLFDGQHYAGGQWHAIYGKLEDIPVFARAGAIVPLGPKVGWGGVEAPEHLTVYAFPGADNHFELYEDDGTPINSAHSITAFNQTWQDNRLSFTIESVIGATAHLPCQRTYELVFRSVKNARVELVVNGCTVEAMTTYDKATETLIVSDINLTPEDTLALSLTHQDGLMSRRDRTLETCRRMLAAFKAESATKLRVDKRLEQIAQDITALNPLTVYLTDSQIRALVEVLTGTGVEHINTTDREDFYVLWNNRDVEGFNYAFAAWEIVHMGYEGEQGRVPRFKVIAPARMDAQLSKFKVNYFDLTAVEYDQLDERYL